VAELVSEVQQVFARNKAGALTAAASQQAQTHGSPRAQTTGGFEPPKRPMSRQERIDRSAAVALEMQSSRGE